MKFWQMLELISDEILAEYNDKISSSIRSVMHEEVLISAKVT